MDQDRSAPRNWLSIPRCSLRGAVNPLYMPDVVLLYKLRNVSDRPIQILVPSPFNAYFTASISVARDFRKRF